ncbi:hypothetical protein OGATHE_006326 [Ogataea polymorpha]|uniref:Uncharacterized protein n=1 Tax=Ogataea polymorpha TaxID=460523 RepID=A0A9P8NUI0_9ASCO|nr:hypothetical protein OGATHE_006326 [Ogataea polymorpha]
MYAADRIPDRYGSSENDSNPRPPRGTRWMLAVGPRITCTPLARASLSNNTPTWNKRSSSQVEARAVPDGIHAVGVLLKWFWPRIPFGPSEVRILGIPNCGRPVVCQ